MQTHFEKELADLRDRLLTMASHAEAAVRQSVEALMSRDESLAQQVRRNDDIIDQYEIEIDDLAIHLLAKAPLASHLRLITVAMRVSQNLERVGDEASKIAKRTNELLKDPPLKQMAEIPELSELALKLLKRALDAFVHQDAAAARLLIPDDKQVDALNRQIYSALADLMMKDPDTVNRALNLIVIAKSLERVADHAKNIAEEIVYLCEAQDIRHSAR